MSCTYIKLRFEYGICVKSQNEQLVTIIIVLQHKFYVNNLFIVNLQYIFPSTQQYDICIYFDITCIIILATCFDSYESSSGINFQELLVHIVLQFFMS